VRVAILGVLVGVEQCAVPDTHRIFMLDNHTRDMDHDVAASPGLPPFPALWLGADVKAEGWNCVGQSCCGVGIAEH
jgi:hypothetical protein